MTVPVFLPGERLPASKLQLLHSGWTSYTPLLTASTTNPTLGTGSLATGAYALWGDAVYYLFRFRFGTGAAAGSGTYRVSLPVAAVSSDRADVGLLGTCELGDDSAGNRYRRAPAMLDTTHLVLQSFGDPFTEVTHASPIPWANLDYIIGSVWYRSAG